MDDDGSGSDATRVAAGSRGVAAARGAPPDPCCSRFGPDPGEFVAHLRATLPRPLVFTNGVFDILHAGHVVCLEEARRLGASLVVGINSDASARRLGKGPGRPFNSAADRARVIAALAPVSAVVFFDEDKPLALICALRPEVYVKGGDYEAGRLAETALMAEWGGRTVIVPRHGELSTTGILERARCPAHAARQMSAVAAVAAVTAAAVPRPSCARAPG